MSSGDVTRDRQAEQEFELATTSGSIYAARNVARSVAPAGACFRSLAGCIADQFQ